MPGVPYTINQWQFSFNQNDSKKCVCFRFWIVLPCSGCTQTYTYPRPSVLLGIWTLWVSTQSEVMWDCTIVLILIAIPVISLFFIAHVCCLNIWEFIYGDENTSDKSGNIYNNNIMFISSTGIILFSLGDEIYDVLPVEIAGHVERQPRSAPCLKDDLCHPVVRSICFCDMVKSKKNWVPSIIRNPIIWPNL